jgi:hypothetical protein
MQVSSGYRDLKMFQSFDLLRIHSLGTLKETIESFFNCQVKFLYEPVRQVRRLFNIDLHANPNRGCYPIDDDTFLIYARIIENHSLISGLGILLIGKSIVFHKRILNHFEGALTRKISHSFSCWFEDSSIVFGDELIIHTICNYCGRGYYDYRQFYHLINFFQKLRTTTFEGKSFSSGLIITKSFSAYKKKNNSNRFGDVFPLKQRRSIKSTYIIDRRFWYLADGKSSFFMANKDLQIQHLFVLDNDYTNVDYIDSNLLSLTLKGGDLLFRIENEKLFSIIIAGGLEFLYLENKWKVRNYSFIKSIIKKEITDDKIINYLLFYLLYCSKNEISSVIWIPQDFTRLSDFVKPDTLNALIYNEISICDGRFSEHIIRYLSSDGATIIDKNGNLRYFGSIVDISKLSISGVSGTGESAAKVLSQNGLSIKISQDGTIKFFISGSDSPLLF